MTAREAASRHVVSPADEADFKKGIVDAIPYVRAFSRTLCGARAAADDLAQETLAKAWQARASFQPGTNLKAWLFMIARNQFYSEKRRSWRSAAWSDELAEVATLLREHAQAAATAANLTLTDDATVAEMSALIKEASVKLHTLVPEGGRSRQLSDDPLEPHDKKRNFSAFRVRN